VSKNRLFLVLLAGEAEGDVASLQVEKRDMATEEGGGLRGVLGAEAKMSLRDLSVAVRCSPGEEDAEGVVGEMGRVLLGAMVGSKSFSSCVGCGLCCCESSLSRLVVPIARSVESGGVSGGEGCGEGGDEYEG
jgi:hypothetical protein